MDPVIGILLGLRGLIVLGLLACGLIAYGSTM
jgi:hypothetical protein